MEEIITLLPNSRAMVYVYEAMTRADSEGKQFHLCTGNDSTGPWVKYKVGEGMWSAPISAVDYDKRHRH